MHIKKGRFYGPSRGRGKHKTWRVPLLPLKYLLADPPTITALKNNFNGILTNIGGEVCCSNLRMYVKEGTLGGGTNSYPCCSYRNDVCLLQKQITAPEAIEHGASDGLIQQEYDLVVCWLAEAKQHHATLPDTETASIVEIRLTVYQVPSTW